MKLFSQIVMFAFCCLLTACGGEEEMNSGAITPDVKAEMEKEKEEVFHSESAHRDAMQQQSKGK